MLSCPGHCNIASILRFKKLCTKKGNARKYEVLGVGEKTKKTNTFLYLPKEHKQDGGPKRKKEILERFCVTSTKKYHTHKGFIVVKQNERKKPAQQKSFSHVTYFAIRGGGALLVPKKRFLPFSFILKGRGGWRLKLQTTSGKSCFMK